MHPLLSVWGRDELAAGTGDVLDVYAEAMDVPLSSALHRRGLILSHLDRRGLRAVAAHEGDRLIGIAYGFLGSPGQWWHDQVRAAMTTDQDKAWLRHAFEVCELHVRPPQQGRGVGQAVLSALLADCGGGTAVLTTPDRETRARAFYRAAGWEDLVGGLVFPGDPRAFAVLGKRL